MATQTRTPNTEQSAERTTQNRTPQAEQAGERTPNTGDVVVEGLLEQAAERTPDSEQSAERAPKAELGDEQILDH